MSDAFLQWKLVGIVGKQSRRMIWACFHIPAQSAFRYSTTAEMYKGNTFYLFWLREAAAIWRVGTPFKSWCILNDQVSTLLPASFFVKKKKNKKKIQKHFFRCRVCSQSPYDVQYLLFTPRQQHLHFLWSDIERRLLHVERNPLSPYVSSAKQILPILCHVV